MLRIVGAEMGEEWDGGLTAAPIVMMWDGRRENRIVNYFDRCSLLEVELGLECRDATAKTCRADNNFRSCSWRPRPL